ncbi:hypothetical protein [Streptomyces sp. NPDC049585]|uniref:hypothetical protein n=1 Tax=Streptomyces sp. NPDC049585 TaxID=3155154 RepID=UPI003414FAE2
MGASRRIRGIRVWEWGRPRLRYGTGAAGLVVAAVVALAGCEPAAGLDATTVAAVTQRQASLTLGRSGVAVAWLTCRGKAQDGGTDMAGSPQPVTIVGIDCEGGTDKGRRIIVFGTVTGVSGTACVRGLLTANVDGRTVFRVSVLGDCTRTGGGGGPSSSVPTAPGPGVPKPPPPPQGGTRGPTVPVPSAGCSSTPAPRGK